MSYMDYTAELREIADKFTDTILEQIMPECKDRMVVEAVVWREMFVAVCTASNHSARKVEERLQRAKLAVTNQRSRA